MSAATPPAPIVGPREAEIRSRWTIAWQAVANGDTYEPMVAIAESRLAVFRSALPAGDPIAAADLNAADVYHLYQRQGFVRYLERQNFERDFLKGQLVFIDKETSMFVEHVVKSLAVAAGGVVIAMLAFLANNSDARASAAPAWVIGLCSASFLLNMLASYATSSRRAGYVTLAIPLLRTNTSESDRTSGWAKLVRHGKISWWCTHPIFYVSVGFLIWAGYLGVQMVRALPAKTPAPPSTIVVVVPTQSWP